MRCEATVKRLGGGAWRNFRSVGAKRLESSGGVAIMFAYDAAELSGFRAALIEQAERFAILGISVTAARRFLEPLVKVRILDPQYV
jgi:hypothetical protein